MRRVAILVGVPSGGVRGIPLFQYNLAKALAKLDDRNEYLLFGYHWRDFAARRARVPVPDKPNFKLAFHRWPDSIVSPMLNRWDLPVFWPSLALAGVRVFHSTGMITPRLPGIRTVTTLHDTILERFPQWGEREGKELLKRWLDRADRLVAVSRRTKADFMEFYGVPDERIQVVPQGYDDETFMPRRSGEPAADVRGRFKLPERYVLTVGPIEPRRNFPVLIRALARAAREPEGKDLALAIVGEDDGGGGELERLAVELGVAGRARFTGHVSTPDLVELYRQAQAFVYPSLYEGFGHSPLEALACGTPVVSSNSSALPEILEGAAELVAPDDVEGFAAAMVRVLRDSALRARLREGGRARAPQFTWTKTARTYLANYNALLD